VSAAVEAAQAALGLVARTDPTLLAVLVGLTAVSGLLPPAVAWVGQRIVDGVVHAKGDVTPALGWLAVEVVLVVGLAVVARGRTAATSLLRARLGHRVNVQILEKALTLDLAHFEDAAFYDRLTRARREASSRPLSLVTHTLDLGRTTLMLGSFGVLLAGFSPWAVLVLVAAGIPSFYVEARFSGEAFRLFSWRAPEAREQNYLETLIAREDYAKEVQIYGLGSFFLDRYRAIFQKVYAEDRSLTLRRAGWGFVVGLLSTAAFYGAYAWIATSAVAGVISVGAMTMYLVVFQQGQSAFAQVLGTVNGLFEDTLYMTMLTEYLGQRTELPSGSATFGPEPGAGLAFVDVSFQYPGAPAPALADVSFVLRPGEKLALVGQNGSGKTTLVKLLTRLYAPTRGKIYLDGLDLAQWDRDALRRRVGVIFQDFARYQLKVGENVGVGDVARVSDTGAWKLAADTALATEMIEALPRGFDAQLGRWFADGMELSGGQWQKVALARMFMRRDADILVLDEPTAAVDAEAEALLFEQFREKTAGKMAILISHRFSTVRRADRILVLHQGRVVEAGTHEALLALDGRYARLFTLQAQGYL
jgi:ATP-binding cassette subfamily B protein